MKEKLTLGPKFLQTGGHDGGPQLVGYDHQLVGYGHHDGLRVALDFGCLAADVDTVAAAVVVGSAVELGTHLGREILYLQK